MAPTPPSDRPQHAIAKSDFYGDTSQGERASLPALCVIMSASDQARRKLERPNLGPVEAVEVAQRLYNCTVVGKVKQLDSYVSAAHGAPVQCPCAAGFATSCAELTCMPGHVCTVALRVFVTSLWFRMTAISS